MKFIIRRGEKILGTLFFNGTLHHFDGDDAFKIKLADMVRAGRPAANVPHFPFVLLDELRARGYGVEEMLVEIEDDFKNYLELIPHDSALYRNSALLWHQMSLLEKTYLLDVLRRDTMTA